MKLLYSKEFPEEEPGSIDQAGLLPGTEYVPPGGDYIQRVLDGVTYRPLSGREELRAEFLRRAVAISELYRLDIRIRKSKSHVSAVLALGQADFMHFLKPLINMADDLGFKAANGKVIMTLDLYTHAVYRGDRLVLPRGLEERGR